MSYKATKPGIVSVLYLSMRYMVLLFIRAPFYVLLVFIAMCAVLCLFWLSYHNCQVTSDVQNTLKKYFEITKIK